MAMTREQTRISKNMYKLGWWNLGINKRRQAVMKNDTTGQMAYINRDGRIQYGPQK